MESAEEKISAVPETLKKKQSSFAELKSKCLRKTIPQERERRCLEKQGGSLSVKKLGTGTQRVGSVQAEVRTARMARKVGCLCVPAELKLALITGVRDIDGVSTKVQNMLLLLAFSRSLMAPL